MRRICFYPGLLIKFIVVPEAAVKIFSAQLEGKTEDRWRVDVLAQTPADRSNKLRGERSITINMFQI